MNRLRKRLERLGTLNDLQKVFADTCCEFTRLKSSPPTHSVLTPIIRHLPGTHRFSVELTKVLDTNKNLEVMQSPTNFHTCHMHAELLTPLSKLPSPLTLPRAVYREVGLCIAMRHEPDIHRVAASIIKNKGCTAEEAMVLATNKHYKKHIRTFTPPDCVQRLRAVRDKYLKLSNESKARGERPLFQ